MPAREADLVKARDKLPFEKSREAYEKRSSFFNRLDVNRNGSLTLGECQKGIAEVLDIDASFDVSAAVKRSFHAAKNWAANTDPNHGDAETVSRQEFRILLRCLHHFLDLKVMFDKLDSSDDYQLSLKEFQDALPKLKEYGISIAQEDSETRFNQIDGNDQGTVCYQEFCTWAMKQKALASNEEDAAVMKELTVQSRIMTDFEKWDINRDGTITREELAICFNKLGSEFKSADLDKIMEVADFNKDGKINYKEFVGWLFSGKTKPATVSDAFVSAALKERGIDNQRVLDGLMIAFDHDEDGDIDGNEFDSMLKHVDDMLLAEEVPDDCPADCKAFIKLANTGKGPFDNPGNPDLKMILTSSGIQPGSTKDLKDTFNALKEKTPGNGLMFLVDARIVKLQFVELNGNPDKHNKQAKVSYRRDPDEPGGKPVYDKDGKLEMKSQAELAALGGGGEGYASVVHSLRHTGRYACGHLDNLADGEGSPVYVSYLWYIGEFENGKPDYKIFVGKGVMKSGKFCAIRADDGKEFTEDDYNLPCDNSSKGDHFFKEVSGSEFSETLSGVRAIYSVGGIPFIPILHFQPHFVNDGDKTKSINPYGKAILDNVKAGNVTYVGMSAGSMSFGWTLGPLTTDPDKFMFADEADGDMEGVDFGPNTELGKIWLFPGLGKYVGIPFDLTLKVHKHFGAGKCSYGGTAAKAEKVAKVVSGVAHKDKYCALLSDYNWDKGQGDALEISGGKVLYHVGYCDQKDDLSSEMQLKLKDLSYEEETIPRQPAGNSPDGWSFEWNPKDGEVISAGPKATQKPFHMYASSDGLMPDAHPAYAGKQ